MLLFFVMNFHNILITFNNSRISPAKKVRMSVIGAGISLETLALETSRFKERSDDSD